MLVLKFLVYYDDYRANFGDLRHLVFQKLTRVYICRPRHSSCDDTNEEKAVTDLKLTALGLPVTARRRFRQRLGETPTHVYSMTT